MRMRPRRSSVGRLVISFPVLVTFGVAACGGDDDGAGATLSAEATEGRRIALRAGCTACHGADGEGGIGPPWAGTLGTEIELEDGTTVVVDEAYLTRSIDDPGAQVHDGFSLQMPQNQLTDDETAAVVAYIVALGGPASTGAGG